MAFSKTGISITTPRPVDQRTLLQPGDMRGGKVWDGEKWVTGDEWKERVSKKAPGAS